MKNPLIDDSLMSVITECCPRLESIAFNPYGLTTEAIIAFGRTLGQRLKSVTIRSNSNGMEDNDRLNEYLFLLSCPNVTSVVCTDFCYFLRLNNTNNEFLPQLESISKVSLRLNLLSNATIFSDFVNKYEKNIKDIDIEINISRNLNDEMTFILDHLSRLSNLEKLSMQIYGLTQDMALSFTKKFSQLGINCKKLNRISLKIFSEFLFKFSQFFGTFTELRELEFWGNRSILYDLHNWRSMKKLKKISIHTYSIEEQFFANIR